MYLIIGLFIIVINLYLCTQFSDVFDEKICFHSCKNKMKIMYSVHTIIAKYNKATELLPNNVLFEIIFKCSDMNYTAVESESYQKFYKLCENQIENCIYDGSKMQIETQTFKNLSNLIIDLLIPKETIDINMNIRNCDQKSYFMINNRNEYVIESGLQKKMAHKDIHVNLISYSYRFHVKDYTEKHIGNIIFKVTRSPNVAFNYLKINPKEVSFKKFINKTVSVPLRDALKKFENVNQIKDLRMKLIKMFEILFTELNTNPELTNELEKEGHVLAYLFIYFIQKLLIYLSVIESFTDEYNEDNSSFAVFVQRINYTVIEFQMNPEVNNSLNDELSVKLKFKENDTKSDQTIISNFILYKELDLTNEEFNNSNKAFNRSIKNIFRNSDLIYASINRQDRNLTIYFKIPTKRKIESRWDFTAEEKCGFLENQTWSWSFHGCRQLEKSPGEFYCECDHLSNFAILISTTPIKKSHVYLMNVLSLIGGIINIIALSMFIAFVCFINSRDKLRLDQLNISICLLFGTATILTSDFALNVKVACKIMALSTQFLFLSAFLWKLILGINAFRGIVLLKYQREDWMMKHPLIALLSGYSIPLVIVTISGSLYWKEYDNMDLDGCWIEADSYKHWFLVPISIILFINCIFLIFIGKALFHNYLRTRKTKVNESVEFLIFLQLLITMGFTWVIAYFGIYFLWAKYLFVICFPFQGLLMFLLVVVINKENRSKVISFISTKYSSLTGKSSSNSDGKRHLNTNPCAHSPNVAANKTLLTKNFDETGMIMDGID